MLHYDIKTKEVTREGLVVGTIEVLRKTGLKLGERHAIFKPLYVTRLSAEDIEAIMAFCEYEKR